MMAPGDGWRATYIRVSAGGLGARTIGGAFSSHRIRGSLMSRKVIIMGAAGRDFHVFNCCYRDNPEIDVVAITAAQIPHIDDREYPAVLAGDGLQTLAFEVLANPETHEDPMVRIELVKALDHPAASGRS